MQYMHLNNKQSIKQINFLNTFWLGFLIYFVGGVFRTSGYVNIKICQAFQSLGLILFIIASIYIIKLKLNNKYLGVIFTLYFIWLITVVIRGIELPIGYDFIKVFLFSTGLIYVAPLILLFPQNFNFYKKLFEVIIIFGICYFLLDIIFIKKLLTTGSDPVSQGIAEDLTEISLPIGFILMTYKYHSGKRMLLAIGIILATLFFTVFRARRGLMVMTLNVIFFSYLLYLFNSKKRILIVYLTVLIVSLGTLYASNIYNINNNKIFGFLAQRGVEDSRTGVEIYFYDDMKPNDWIVGRGLMGQYFCPDMEQDQVTNYRSVIETGYLQIILKGGIISLVLLLLITIPASIQGIFFSNNILSKAAGIWIFLFMINLYPQNAVSFNFSYLLVWISVGICFSKGIRKMTDDDIRDQILSSGKNNC